MKHIITITSLLAAGTICASAVDCTKWSFENSVSSDTGSTHAVENPQWVVKRVTTSTGEDGQETQTTSWVNGTAVYADSIAQGTVLGNYKVGNDMGKALSFDGDSFLKLGDAYWSNGNGTLNIGPNGTNDFTIMSYVNFSSVTGDGIALFGTGNAGQDGLIFGVKDGKFKITAKRVVDNITTKAAVSVGTWAHVAVSYDASERLASFYLNGELFETKTLTCNFNSPGGAGAAIGSSAKDSPNDLFSGLMDDFQIYVGSGAAFTAEEIRSAAGLIAIPEPSAFGLLAGLGALALAGTRRRRAKKA